MIGDNGRSGTITRGDHETGTHAARLGGAAHRGANARRSRRRGASGRRSGARRKPRRARAVHRLGGARGARTLQHAGEPRAVRRAGARRRGRRPDERDDAARRADLLLGAGRVRRGLPGRSAVAAHGGVASLDRGAGAYFLAIAVGTPMATGRITAPAAPFSRGGRIMVQESHTRSRASSSSFAFSTWWMPACVSIRWWTAK